MQTRISNSQLAVLDALPVSAADSDWQQEAWHLLSLLIAIGSPAPLPDLASRCTLFPATPDLIRFLCAIPRSPIAVFDNGRDDLYVTVSPVGFLSLCRFFGNCNSIDYFGPRIGSSLRELGIAVEELVRFCAGKRKRFHSGCGGDVNDGEAFLPSTKRIRSAGAEGHFDMTEGVDGREDAQPSYMQIELNRMVFRHDLFFKNVARTLNFNFIDIKQIELGETSTRTVVKRREQERIVGFEVGKESAVPSLILDDEKVRAEAKTDNHEASFVLEDDKHGGGVSALEFTGSNYTCHATNDSFLDAIGSVCPEGGWLNDSFKMGGEEERLSQTIESAALVLPLKNQGIFPVADSPESKRPLSRPSKKMKMASKGGIPPRKQVLYQSLEQSKVRSPPKETYKHKRDPIPINRAQNKKCDNIQAKEANRGPPSVSPVDQKEPGDLPVFESYTVQEEEGSGGYGTVYRATRNRDGATVAIKCPHANAHRHHVMNELRMLQRFGGKNYVIKYEECFKRENSDCFVLEYAEHDRPEILKKEIDISQLRWYGYCMFKALASLHKQGVVHRDVKPGNFLFSRKANKGYLIDFNLAMDLRQKYGTAYNSKAGNDTSSNHLRLPNSKSVPLYKTGGISASRVMIATNQEKAKGSGSTLEPKNLKKKPVDQTKTRNDFGGFNLGKSRGAEGSGITSVKDGTSTRTSAERMREPLPSQGRKELISLLQSTMQGPNHEVSSVPATIRKRIAAPPGKVGGIPIYVTPMPLHSSGIGLFNNIGDGKHKKEGTCVGTKGFRAPEVLLRCLHQGPKVDIWSAGVTLLYLVIGKTPFYGEPEQNLKDIAKLTGSEVLWEVSKLNDRESSFPVLKFAQELYNDRYLPSMSLHQWCRMNTKRRDFLDIIPDSLVDLVDKCLTVNPRQRISAEEALKHDFFAPCHDAVRKHRQMRQLFG